MNSADRKDFRNRRALGIGVIAFIAVLVILLSAVRRNDPSQQDANNPLIDSATSVSAAEAAFIEASFDALTEWRFSSLRRYLADDTLRGMSEDEMSRVLELLQLRFGELLFNEPPQRIADLTKLNLPVQADLKAYHFNASFEKALAEVYLVISEQQSGSRLYAFNIQERKAGSGPAGPPW